MSFKSPGSKFIIIVWTVLITYGFVTQVATTSTHSPTTITTPNTTGEPFLSIQCDNKSYIDTVFTANITCAAHFKPRFERHVLTWYKGNSEIRTSERINITIILQQYEVDSEYKTWVVFEDIHGRDTGNYSLVISTLDGQTTSTGHLYLKVFSHPSLRMSTNSVYASKGSDPIVNCTVENPDDLDPQDYSHLNFRWIIIGLRQTVTENRTCAHQQEQGCDTQSNTVECACVQPMQGPYTQAVRIYNIQHEWTVHCSVTNFTVNATSRVDIINEDSLVCDKAIDSRETVWDVTAADETLVVTCPEGFKGTASRHCGEDGQWIDANYLDCIRNDIQDVADKIKNIDDGTSAAENIENAVHGLATVTDNEKNPDLTAGDIQTVVDSLSSIVNVVQTTIGNVRDNVAEASMSVVNNVLSGSTQAEWGTIHAESNSSVVTHLLNVVTDIGYLTADSLEVDADPTVIVKDNIVTESGKITPRDISFPNEQIGGENNGNESIPACRRAVSSKVKAKTLQNMKKSSTVKADGIKYTAVLYTTLGYLLAGGNEDTQISIEFPSVAVLIENNTETELDPPIELTFQSCEVIQNPRRKRDTEQNEGSSDTETKHVKNPDTCYRKEDTELVWKEDICKRTAISDGETQCSCKKSGTFAASLKDFLKKVKKFLTKYTGLLPILGVMVKMGHTFYKDFKGEQKEDKETNSCEENDANETIPSTSSMKQRVEGESTSNGKQQVEEKSTSNGKQQVEEKRSLKEKMLSLSKKPLRSHVLGLLLCLTIIISNVELITGVDMTENKDTCMAIAGTLQFFYTTECFYFIVLSIDDFLNDDRMLSFLLLIGIPWVLSAVLVGIAVESFGMQDYLSKNICWLSKDNGAYLFLIIPAAIVPIFQLAVMLRHSEKKKCLCGDDSVKGYWKKIKRWVKDHRHHLEFATGMAMVSAQVFLSVIAQEDEDVKDIFFGIFTSTKLSITPFNGVMLNRNGNLRRFYTRQTTGLTLALTGMASDESVTPTKPDTDEPTEPQKSPGDTVTTRPEGAASTDQTPHTLWNRVRSVFMFGRRRNYNVSRQNYQAVPLHRISSTTSDA